MPESSRLTEFSGGFELDFVEREATPEPLMKLSIHLHSAVLSLSDTVSVLDSFGVDRYRTTVHNWMQKADLQPKGGKSPNQIALDETTIRIDGERYWLLAAVDPKTNDFLYLRLHPACTTTLTERFLRELRRKHDVETALFLVDGAPWLQTALRRSSLRFQHETHGNRNVVERVFKEVKRRTNQFENHFRHASPETADSWLQTLTFAWYQLI